MRTISILFLAMLAVACGKKDSDKKGGEGGGSTAATDVSAVNAAVPKELAGKLQFEAAKGEKDRFSFAAPRGWKAGVMPGSYQPPDDANFGFMTRYSVSTNCDGDCSAKDWAAVTDKVEFAQLTGGDFTVDKDEKADGSRFVVARSSDGSVVVAAAWWKKDAPHYVYCRAKLDGDAAKALAAFEKACRSVSISSWD